MKTLFDKEVASRLNAFSFDPEAILLIEDPNHPRYDARVILPLKPEFVASIRTHGIGQAVVIRRDPVTGEAEAVDGRQRIRAARLINKEAGECLIKVPCTVRKGDEADAYTMTVVLNEHRQDDEKREKIIKAQRLAQLGRTDGDIALAMGVSVQTAKKWVNSNPKTTNGVRKARGPSGRPSIKEIAELYESASNKLDQYGIAVVEWILGKGPRP